MKTKFFFLVLPMLLIMSFILNPSDPITIEQFLQKPFGFEPTVANFNACRTPRYKLKKYVFKKHPTDTIYQYRVKRTTLYFNRSQQREIFFSGLINSKKVNMLNNIRVGMSKEHFIRSFTNLSADYSDTIDIHKEGFPNVYSFIFSNGQLKLIKISNKQP